MGRDLVTGVDPRTLKAGQRVRATVQGVVQEEWSGCEGAWPLIDWDLSFGPHTVVEVLPDPLPTVPGARFWGATLSTESQWWFVQAYGSGGQICYAAADGRSISGDGVQSSYLRVLPEPTERCDA
jgi:hypothetical protein